MSFFDLVESELLKLGMNSVQREVLEKYTEMGAKFVPGQDRPTVELAETKFEITEDGKLVEVI